MKREVLIEAIYGENSPKKSADQTVVEEMYSNKNQSSILVEDAAFMYNNIAQPKQNPNVLARNRGTHMTTARTRRHVTINIGEDRVTLPSPQFVYDLELKIKKLENDCTNLINNLRSVVNTNNNLKREIDQLKRELRNKVDYPS